MPWRPDSEPYTGAGTGNIPNFSEDLTMTNWNIGDTDAVEANQLYWHKITDGAKTLLVCDRVILVGVSWDDLNGDNRVFGKTITIDGQPYKLRLLTGGSNYRSGTDAYSGGTPTTNEWDRFITNEESIAGIPTPAASDLDSTLNSTDKTSAHNQLWNWMGVYSWAQETYTGNSAYRAHRGYNSARYWHYVTASNRNTYVGWRPVLEVLNAAPLTPGNLSPAGTSATPAMVETLTPTIAWSFSDPDVGNTQSAYQVIIKKKSDNTVVKNTGKVLSGSTTYAVPVSTLQPNTDYYYTVQVWDNADASSPVSAAQYFKTTQAPTATPTSPLGTIGAPAGSNTAPRLSWSYSDPEGHAQAKSQVLVKRASDNVTVYDSGLVANANPYWDVPAGNLVAGVTYYWQVKVQDATGMDNGSYTTAQYFLTNVPPPTPTPDPIPDMLRVSKRPVFVATAGDDVENDSQSFCLQLATDSGFIQGLLTFDSLVDITGWEYFDGTAWQPFPAGGKVSAANIEGKKLRYTLQQDLVEGTTYYWRMSAKDGTTGTASAWTGNTRIRCGNVFALKLKNPLVQSAPVNRVVFSKFMTVPAGATLKVEVCNNGLDASPTWEDCTAAFLSGDYYRLTNTNKTAAQWALDLRVTIEANDQLGAIEFDAFGVSYD